MKTLATAIQKGGQGKTFLTCHLAFDFQERGLRVVVIDLDIQGNASFTLQAHRTGITSSELFSLKAPALRKRLKELSDDGLALVEVDPALANLEKMKLGDAAKALRSSVAILGEFFDVCLMDTPPSLGIPMTAALLAADYTLSPIQLEAYSLQGMKQMVSIIGNLRQQNPALTFLGMIPNMVDARKPRHMANLKWLKESYPQLIMPFSIGSRDSIAEALGQQIPVWKVRKTAARKAATEVRGMADHVYKLMEIER